MGLGDFGRPAPGRSIGYQGAEQLGGLLRDFAYGTIERCFIRSGRLSKAANLPHELQSSSVNLVLRCRWLEVI